MDKSNKLYVLFGILILVAIIFLSRLFYLQIVDESNYYKAQAYGSNEITVYPARGTIVDRYGELMVYNDARYDLMAVPIKAKDFDKELLSKILQIDTLDLNKRIIKAARYNSREASVIYKNIPIEIYTKLQEILYQFPAFYIEAKIDRRYSIHGAAHLLGYMGEVNDKDLKKDKYYKPGDIHGITGMEKS